MQLQPNPRHQVHPQQTNQLSQPQRTNQLSQPQRTNQLSQPQRTNQPSQLQQQHHHQPAEVAATEAKTLDLPDNNQLEYTAQSTMSTTRIPSGQNKFKKGKRACYSSAQEGCPGPGPGSRVSVMSKDSRTSSSVKAKYVYQPTTRIQYNLE